MRDGGIFDEPWDKHPKHAKLPMEAEAPAASARAVDGGAPAAARPQATPRDAGASGRATGGEKRTAWDFAAAGTYVDSHAPRAAASLFLALALVAVLIPSVGMAWFRTDSTTENRELAEIPALQEGDGSPNVDMLSDLGAYFDDHFAFRNQLVSLNAAAYSALGSSPTDQVVVGTGGWLYYGGTLPDYLGQGQLSERGLANIAHNLKLAQGFVESRGGTFAFAVAPNKNTLYPQHMPYYYLRWDRPGNLDRLVPLLQREGVNYVDLKALFREDPGTWYLKTDSHWDNRGALLAAEGLLAALGRGPLPVDVDSAVPRADFAGDLESMLMPFASEHEVNWYYGGYNDGREAGDQNRVTGSQWGYASDGAHDVTADWVQTRSGADGSVLVFRDSFGNALLPYLAASYGDAAFSKLVPYNLPMADSVAADAVVVERAERHLGYLAQNPPIMPNPRVAGGDGFAGERAAGPATTLTVRRDGPYWVLEGSADPSACDTGTGLYVKSRCRRGEARVYDAFWMSVEDGRGGSNDYGFRVYVAAGSEDLEGSDVEVYASDGDQRVLLERFADVEVEG